MTTKQTTRLRKELGGNVARIRKEKAMTQETLASKSGIHRVTISRVENGQLTPGIALLKQLAKALSTTLEALIP